MLRGWNTFSKTVLLIIIVLLPIALIFGYTNQISVQVIEKELQDKALKRLSFFGSQVDVTVDQLSVLAIVLSRDPTTRKLLHPSEGQGAYEHLQEQEEFIQKMSLLSATSGWPNRLTIYYPGVRQAISSDYYGIYDEDYLKKMSQEPHGTWVYNEEPKGNDFFAKLLFDPSRGESDFSKQDEIVEVRFSKSNLTKLLQDFAQDEKGNSFFYKAGAETIAGQETDASLVAELKSQLDQDPPEEEGYRIASVDGESYMVDYVRSASLGWHAVSYTPLKDVLSPIDRSRNLFYASLLLMLLLGLAASLALYRQVQVPINKLLRGIQRIQTGEYVYRIRSSPRSEFDILILKFNQMSDEIQRLVEKVHAENIRYRDAQLKHLQAQINPHFLSNSLFFIKNMVAVDDKEAATKMIISLGAYYRYVTRLEHTMTSLKEELELIEHYLIIQNLRLERFHYEISLPEEMGSLRIPRLLVQPIVENAILHTIERTGRYGIIDISCERAGDENRVYIDDNGADLTEEIIRKLQSKTERPVEEGEGFGIWNVQQRLHYQFGPNAGLSFSRSPLGGLRVTIRWREPMDERIEGGLPDAASAR
ncbi:sensor histidine kinase [Cohnella sp. AR92]|uniref:sensor histidine kinase n=1 Tax=Cohnella sp. AR92 TaxID=648716 RepID=UPI000F8E892A|nr:histidine kinase [Cohnella sp. AR92]RUS43801.1 HAMP domain-containing protein [Cohnella sp. AR92]